MSALPPAPPALPAPRQPFGIYRVCLVCLGNICRSPMAEVVLHEELARAGLAGLVAVDSAGTGDWHIGERMDAGARRELARRGYDGSAHRARQFRPDWFARYDLVVVMDHRNLAALGAMAGQPGPGRVRLLRSFDPALPAAGDPYQGDVPDPYGGESREYALALDLVLPAVRGLSAALARLLAPAGAPPRQR